MGTQVLEPQLLVGTWRRFGSLGPVYQVLSEGAPSPNGDRRIRIHVLESGEELDYGVDKISDDPREA
jgi:hypothetical protein